MTLTEARGELGGRVTLESTLPGLAEYARVRDWRVTQIGKLPNVDVHVGSLVDEEQILEFDADHVALATGAKWRRDGTGRWLEDPVDGWDRPSVITPDNVMMGVEPDGPVVVYDDDHYYIGGVVAEKLRRTGLEVVLVTPANEVSTWTTHTEEQHRIQTRLLDLGVSLETGTTLGSVGDSSVVLECVYTGRERETDAACVVMATSRIPEDSLYFGLKGRTSVQRIGDCNAPGTIATSVLLRASLRPRNGRRSTERRAVPPRAVSGSVGPVGLALRATADDELSSGHSTLR